jgi:uncharacterized membrane protein
MNSSNEQQPITTENATSTEKTSKQTKNMAWLYVLLAIGVIVIGVGVVLVFLLK